MLEKLTLLYVEDDEMIIAIMEEMLDKLFGKLYFARSGQEGIELFEKHRPDMVMTDISMPDMDGLEMASKIKQRDSDVPIVLMTGMTDSKTMSKAINIGIDGYLIKPIRFDKMTSLFLRLSRHIETKKELVREKKLLDEYRKAVDSSALVSKMDLDGLITYVNDSFCKVSGYDREELIGAHHNIIRHPDMPTEVFDQMWQTILNKQIWKGTLKNRRKDGTAYYVSTTTVPILNEDDEIEQFLSLRHDVTELENHKQQLKAMVDTEVEKNIQERKKHEEERLQAAKFMAIGKLAAGITHEINTPLTYMRGNMEMLYADIRSLEDGKQKSLMLEDATSILSGVNRIAAIVESMREVASQTTEQFEPSNIYATLQTALVMAYNRAKQITPIILQGETFELGMDKEAFSYMASLQKQRIEQVWIIIISNALDVLQSIEPYEARRLEITIEQENTQWVVSFKDSGGGIDEAMQPKLFEAFESNKSGGGMGIGLNLAKKIVQEQQGTITACNEGNGARFDVRLPKA